MNIIPEWKFGEVERNFYLKQLSLTSGSSDDLERLYLQSVTSSSKTDIQSLWKLYLQSLPSSVTTDLRGSWKAFLVSQGYTKDIYTATSAYFIANS